MIKPLTLDVADGEFIVMAGRQAAGNRRCCAWLPGWSGDGRRYLDQRPAGDRNGAERSGIAMVFQNYALYPHMSVEETWRGG